MTITARFASNCRQCHGRIEAGEQINWIRGAGATHVTCPQQQLAVGDATAPVAAVTEPGVYEHPELGIFVVKPNRQRTRLYAKRLVEIGGERLAETGAHVQIEFEYAPGAINQLTPEMRMPLERAKELTIRYGRCIVCGRRLKAAESVERGIGPVCILSFGGAAAWTAAPVAEAPEPVAKDGEDGPYQRLRDANRALAHARNRRDAFSQGREPQGVLAEVMTAQLESDRANREWIAWKNAHGRREAIQERAAYEQEHKAEMAEARQS